MGAFSLAVAVALAAEVLATLDRSVVTRQDYTYAAQSLGSRAEVLLRTPDLRRQFLNDLIDHKLLATRAEGVGLHKTEEFAARLNLAREAILAEMYAKAFVAERNTQAHQRDFFRLDPARFGNREVRATHIVVDDEATAQAILQTVVSPGADFEAIARTHANSGDLGFFGRGRMLPEFEQAAFQTEKGQIHPRVIKTVFGWHVLKVTDTRGDDTVSFESVQKEVQEALNRHLRAELRADARAKSQIKIDAQALRGLAD